MKLGITGLLPNFIGELDAASLRRVREMGFTGSALPGGEPPVTVSTERAREVGRIAAGEGVEFVEYGHYQTTFVDPDGAVRAETLATLREAARVAAAAGCPFVIAGIGSLSHGGHWFADARNFTSEARKRLVLALREAASAVESHGVGLALECHVTTSLRNAAVGREVLDEVGARSLKIHLDPVNWMTMETVFDSGPAITDMFATLGASRISGAHSKGVVLEDRLICHMNETFTGAGDDLLDHAALLRGLSSMPEETYLVIEHLTVEQMPIARARLLAVASELGLSFTGQGQ